MKPCRSPNLYGMSNTEFKANEKNKPDLRKQLNTVQWYQSDRYPAVQLIHGT